MDTEPLNDLKLNTKIWLKAKGLDYAWLAEKCYVSESTVRNWMARRAIPLVKQDIIRNLIEREPIVTRSFPIEVKSETFVSIHLASEVRQSLESKAAMKGLSLEQYLLDSLTELSEH